MEGINPTGTSEKLSHGSKLPPMSKDLELRALEHWASVSTGCLWFWRKHPGMHISMYVLHVPSGMDLVDLGTISGLFHEGVWSFLSFIYFIILFLIVLGVRRTRQVLGLNPGP